MFEGKNTSNCKSQLASDILAQESTPPKKKASVNAQKLLLLENSGYRKLTADDTVKKWCVRSSIAGFIGIPVADTISIGTLQALMVRELCTVYNISFKKEIVASIISGLAGSSITTIVSTSLGTTVLRQIPVVGSALNSLTQPAIAYAMTHALGVVFIKHFEQNGDLVDFPTEKIRDVFVEKYHEASQTVRNKFRSSVPSTQQQSSGS